MNDEPHCFNCIYYSEGYCWLGKTDADKFYETPASKGGCATGLKYNLVQIERKPRPEPKIRPAYAWR